MKHGIDGPKNAGFAAGNTPCAVGGPVTKTRNKLSAVFGFLIICVFCFGFCYFLWLLFVFAQQIDKSTLLIVFSMMVVMLITSFSDSAALRHSAKQRMKFILKYLPKSISQIAHMQFYDEERLFRSPL